MRMIHTMLLAAAFFAAPAGMSVASDDKAMDHAMSGETVKAGDLTVSGSWIRAMLPGQKVGGGFLVIVNGGDADDRLVSVSTPHAGKSEIHEMAVVDDVMKMRALPDGLSVPAGDTVTLKPGGYHLMFMGIETPFQEGAMIPVTLVFEKAGAVEMMMPVMPANTKAMHGHGG